MLLCVRCVPSQLVQNSVVQIFSDPRWDQHLFLEGDLELSNGLGS